MVTELTRYHAPFIAMLSPATTSLVKWVPEPVTVEVCPPLEVSRLIVPVPATTCEPACCWTAPIDKGVSPSGPA